MSGSLPAFIQTPGEKLARKLTLGRSLLMLSIAITPALAQAQHDHDDDHDDDHHHAPLHFAHPIFTESPSPDTKIRLDYFHSSIAKNISDHAVRIEAEYAFTRNISIEANIPIVRRRISDDRTTAFGSSEIAVKLANFSAAKSGLLLGGGLAFELPAAANDAGIGNDHTVEIEPYIDIGYMRGPLELVSFASFSTVTRRREGEEKEQDLAIAASLLYHIGDFESLVEVATDRALTGEESGDQSLNAGVGIKYHVPRHDRIVIGAGARAPLTKDKDFRHEILASFFYHF